MPRKRSDTPLGPSKVRTLRVLVAEEQHEALLSIAAAKGFTVEQIMSVLVDGLIDRHRGHPRGK